MKKKVFLFVAVLFATLASSAETIRYNAHCGGDRIVSTYTVSPDFFDSWEDAAAYYLELREILCE